MNRRTPARHARTATLCLLASLLVLGCVRARAQSVAGAQASPPVSVLFTAVGKDGNFVTTLKPEDVRLIVDGRPRGILEMKRQGELPLFIAVVLDTSASQERVLPNTKRAAVVFVRGMLKPGADRAAVVTFSGETVLEQSMTDDVSKLREAIERVKFVPPPGYVGGVVVGGPPYGGVPRAGSTGVWDAVYLVSDEVLSRSLGTGRRAMLLATDGVDTSSRLKLDDAVESALQSDSVVYVLGVGDDKRFDGVEKGPLRKLAERTGGRAFFPKKVDEITPIFQRISQELLSQSVVTFADPAPARDGSFHKVKLELTNRELRGQGVELAYPEGFYAGNAPTAVRK
ncbi:MAG TPA: VWA domain-containing protein [Pyrinomonadaceae bacterium]|jgi:VWFA-related protein|nr:VWA domain-containing protein [Pyrinomonadaceae bacterium]